MGGNKNKREEMEINGINGMNGIRWDGVGINRNESEEVGGDREGNDRGREGVLTGPLVDEKGSLRGHGREQDGNANDRSTTNGGDEWGEETTEHIANRIATSRFRKKIK